MGKGSRRLYEAFSVLSMTGFAGLITCSIAALFVENVTTALYFLPIAAGLAGLSSGFGFMWLGLNRFVLFVLNLVAHPVIFIAVESAAAALTGTAPRFSADSPVLALSLVNAFFSFLFYLSCQSPAMILWRLLEGEKNFEKQDEYIRWINGEFGGHERYSDRKWFINRNTTWAMLAVIITIPGSFLAPALALPLSVFSFLLFLGGLGSYLVLNGIYTVIRHKSAGLKVPPETETVWLKSVRGLLLPVMALSLLIPWNFRVVDTRALAEELRSRLSSFTVTIDRSDYYNQLTNAGYTNRSSLTNTVSNTVVSNLVNPDVPAGPEGPTPIQWLWYLILAWLGLELTGSAAGLVLNLVYRRKAPPAWAAFLIRVMKTNYDRLQGVLIFVLEVLKFVAGALGLRSARKNVRKTASPVEKRLLALWSSGEKQSDEKKKEMEIIVARFVEIITEASRSVTPWYFYLGPLEYIDRLRSHIPDASPELTVLAALFNESRYSPRLLDNSQTARFLKAADMVMEALKNYVKP